MKKQKTKKQPRVAVINIKINDNLRKKLQSFADRYAEGNLSAWLRHAGMNYAPSKGERVISVKHIPGF